MVAIALIAFLSFGMSAKKTYKDEYKEMQALNENIVKLNMNFEHMLENDKIRDKRIEKHGAEIDQTKDRVSEVEHMQKNHETRLQALERNRGA